MDRRVVLSGFAKVAGQPSLAALCPDYYKKRSKAVRMTRHRSFFNRCNGHETLWRTMISQVSFSTLQPPVRIR